MSKVWLNLSGTTADTFSVGKNGPTVYHGTSVPVNSTGSNGDLYVQVGSSPGFYQRTNGIWQSLVPTTFQRQQITRGSSGTVNNITTYVGIVTGTASSTIVNLPSGVEGMQIIIKDETGTAQNYNIAIKSGATTVYTINTGYGAVTLAYTNGAWYSVRKVT